MADFTPNIDTDEAIVGFDGLIATAPLGATAPTGPTSVLTDEWDDQGLVTDAGATRSEQVTATVLRAWQRARKVKRVVSEGAVRHTFVLIQTGRPQVELFHGREVDSDGKVVVDPTVERPNIAFLIDVINDDDQVVREYLPNAQVTEVGDQVAVSNGIYGWPITIESDYDDEIDGHSVRWFSALAEDAS